MSSSGEKEIFKFVMVVQVHNLFCIYYIGTSYEYRSPECFELDWPMCMDHAFFFVKPSEDEVDNKTRPSTARWKSKNRKEKSNDEEQGVCHFVAFIKLMHNQWPYACLS